MDEGLIASVQALVGSLPEADQEYWRTHPGLLREAMLRALSVSTFKVPLVSCGRTGPEWLSHLESLGLPVSEDVQRYLQSGTLVPTSGVQRTAVIINGAQIGNHDRVLARIRGEYIHRRGYKPITIEFGLLLREALAQQDIVDRGLVSITCMHESDINLKWADYRCGLLALEIWQPSLKVVRDSIEESHPACVGYAFLE